MQTVITSPVSASPVSASPVSASPVGTSPAITSPAVDIEPLVVPAGAGQYVDLGDHRGLAKVGAVQSGGAMLFSEFHTDFQAGVPAHSHTREEETFYILEGCFEFTVGGKLSLAGPGDTIFAPRNFPHSWLCTSLEGGRLLLLITPGANFEAFAIEMARRRYEPAAAIADPATRDAFLTLCADHGIRFEPEVLS